MIKADAAALRRVAPIERRRRLENGAFCPEWLQYCELRQPSWLNAPPDSHSYLPTSLGGTVLGDAVCWAWSKPGELSFSHPRGALLLSAPRKRAFEVICKSLVFSYPELIRRPRTADSMRPYRLSAERHHAWRLRADGMMTTHDTAMPVAEHEPSTSPDADRAAAGFVQGESVMFHARPQLTRLVQVWGRAARWRPQRRTLKHLCKPARTATGVANRDRRIRL